MDIRIKVLMGPQKIKRGCSWSSVIDDGDAYLKKATDGCKGDEESQKRDAASGSKLLMVERVTEKSTERFVEITKRHKILAWKAGYYNGQIKTRKATQPAELNADETGFERSKQLRKLYESLISGGCSPQTKRPCTSLSPEDLSDTEWYYLICMSFTFAPGQGLPGKAFAKNQYTWLDNTVFAAFSRSILTKSGGIQTILCIPIMGGVLELGTTEQVTDDSALATRVASFFWEIPNTICTDQCISNLKMAEDGVGILCPGIGADNSFVSEEQNLSICRQTLSENAGQANIPFTEPSYGHAEKEPNKEVSSESRAGIFGELNLGFPKDSSNECCPTRQRDDLFRIDGLNGMFQTQNEQLMDDDFSNVLDSSLNSNEDVDVNAQRTRNTMLDNLQEGNHSKLFSLDLDGEDSHYTNTVTSILQNSKLDRKVLCSLMASHNSSFVCWRRDFNTPEPLTGMTQNLLKKILVHRVWLQSACQLKQHQGKKGPQKNVVYPKGESGPSHVLSERRRREQMNEKILALRSLIPSPSKIDKASVLGDTIEYLKELQRRVHQLETCKQPAELNTRDYRRNHPDAAGRTSDNRCSKEMMNRSRNSPANKRKACEIDQEHRWVLSSGGRIAINATVTGREVLVEIHCPWRECLLLQIVESISELHLDPLMVQSSITDGILALTIKSEFRSSTAASPGMIKELLERMTLRCL